MNPPYKELVSAPNLASPVAQFLRESGKEFDSEFYGVIFGLEQDYSDTNKKDIKSFNASQFKALLGVIRGEIENKMPCIGIMAAMNISSEAVEYVNGFNKLKSEILNLLDTAIDNKSLLSE